MTTAAKPEAVKINCLQIENVKRVQAVQMECGDKALTIIGGKNGQGKTSILDAIMWALGGDRFRPSNPTREGADEASVSVSLSNGITVERGGKNGALKVIGAPGKSGGQSLLNDFINVFALNLPKFMQATGTEKAQKLLELYPGLGKALEKLNAEAKRIYDERTALGQIQQRKQKHAEDLPFHSDVPEHPLSGSEMTKRLEKALSHNAANEGQRRGVGSMRQDLARMAADQALQEKRVADLEQQLTDARQRLDQTTAARAGLADKLSKAEAALSGLVDESTAEIQKELEQIDAINAKIRTNQDKHRAETEAQELAEQYQALTGQLEAVRAERIKLLTGVEMPLPALSINEAGDLIYRGQPWDGMSGAEQLQVATAISAAVKPECGFVLLDKLEALDIDTLREFGAWLQERNLQAIGTRVSTGDECSIVIEDGHVAGVEIAAPAAKPAKKAAAYKF